MNNNELQQVKTESFTISEDLLKIEVLETLSIEDMERVVGGLGPAGTSTSVMVFGNHNGAVVVFN